MMSRRNTYFHRNTDYGSDIRQWIAQPGDQALTVPNGTYTAGAIVSGGAHAATAGTYGGWLVLVAQTQGSVVVDMSPPPTWTSADTDTYDLVLGGTTTRVLFVGFKFLNGIVRIGCPKIRFWHCEFTFPAATWAAENGHSNTSGGFYHQYHAAPRTLYFTAGNEDVDVYGCSLHDTGTAIFSENNGTTDLLIRGTEIYSLTDGGSGSDPLDTIHPDGMALFGATTNAQILDTYVHPGNEGTAGMVLYVPGSGTRTFTLNKVWVTDCGNGGVILDCGASGGVINGSMTNVHSWGNGTGHGAEENEPAWNAAQYVNDIDIGAYSLTSYPQPSRISFTTATTDIGITQTGTDPATAWKTAGGQALGDWATFFSGNWP